MGPKSGFDPDIDVVPEESAIIQASPDLWSLLLPSLAMMISQLFSMSSNFVVLDKGSCPLWKVVDVFG